MKKILFAIAALSFLTVAHAQKVTVDEAKTAASSFLSAAEPHHPKAELSLYQTINDHDGNPVIYIFNIGDSGFIAFGADMMYDPLIGYSFFGAYDSTRIAPNLKAWLAGFVDDVSAVKKNSTKSNDIILYHKDCQKKWDDLLNGDTKQLAAKSAKGVESLLETKWDQGAGYNNYCPSYSHGPNGHSYTGCVATAMAQIIRYHRYPNTGFSRHGYYHSYHGYQYAAYDSVTFDFGKMPSQVHYNSSQSYQHNVSLLCYYCGVSVNMNYLNPGHTTGSGAHSQDVPDGFKYFGYMNTFYMSKTINNDIWDSLIRHDLDNDRPIYYSGANNEGGHAFVLEGYRENGTYQFNFGWSGYGDGFFTISHVGGYSTGQAAVFNIRPSHFTALGDTIYIASDGEGGGSSWDDANPNLHDAIGLANMCGKKNIWVKGGTYKGEESSPYSFTMESKVSIYGGFSGTESSLDERDSSVKSIMSGDGKRIAFYSPSAISNANIYDMTIADGYAMTGAGATINDGLRMERCTVENNTATEGAALHVSNNTIYNCIIHNNSGGGVSLKANSSIRNSLIVHNDGFGIQLSNSGIDGCNIVCNNGTGVINDTTTEMRVRNSVIWNNTTQLETNDTRNFFFCAIEDHGDSDSSQLSPRSCVIDSNSNFGLTHDNRPDDGIGPIFMDPDLTVGRSQTIGDWHISSRSPLVDAGDTVRSGAYIRDLDGENRFRNGRSDIGCYEWIPGNAIQDIATNLINVYPNPASSTITIEGIQGQADIYDIMGRHILSLNLNGEPTTIDANNLPKGLYLLRTKTITKKFFKL